MDRQAKGTYLTGHLNRKLISKYNKKEFIPYFEDKGLFAKTFGEFLGRDWITLKDLDARKLERFVKGKDKVIYKPLTSYRSYGTEKLELTAFDDANSLHRYLRKKYGNDGILEDWVDQHPSVSELYPQAVNPIRLITILDNGECNMITSTISVGYGGDIANYHRGSLIAPIDLRIGKITSPAQVKSGELYAEHPITGTRIVGFEVPYWREILEMIERAARVVPEIAYVGWDVAVTPSGPVILEGNHNPGYHTQQMPAHLVNGVGRRVLYERFL